MCKRSDDDLLVRILTDRYKLNILRLPRHGVGVGELLIKEGKDLRCVGSIKSFFDPELDISLNAPAVLPDVDGVTSARRSAKIAAAPLIGLLTALGAAGISSIGASLSGARDVSVVFSLIGTRYRSTDLATLGDELSSRVLRQDNALYQPGREFFVAYAAAEATGIKCAFTAASDKSAGLTLELAQAIKTEASVTAVRDGAGQLIISCPEPVTFGLAVVQLTMDGSSLRFKTGGPLRAIRGDEAKSRSTNDVPSILFGGSDGDALVEIS